MTNIKPLFANVLVEPEQEKVRDSGIVLPGTISKEKPKKGKVIAVGADCKVIKEGNTVIFKEYSPREFKDGDKNLLIINEEDILATC